jgi:hypothetical protein
MDQLPYGTSGICPGSEQTSDPVVQQLLNATVQIKVNGSFSHGAIVDNGTILTHGHFYIAGIDSFSGNVIEIFDSTGNLICSPCSFTRSVGFVTSTNGDSLDLIELSFSNEPFSDFSVLPTRVLHKPFPVGQDIAIVDYIPADSASGARSVVVWTTVSDTAYVTRHDNPTVPHLENQVSGLQVDYTVARGSSGGAAAMILDGRLIVVGINSSHAGDSNIGFITFAYR